MAGRYCLAVFRPCIDLHEGKVKQLVGGTLAGPGEALKTNFVSERPAAWFAELYRKDRLLGGHVIMLGPGNDAQAKAALKAYPQGLQVGGGITPANAVDYLEAGASHVIVTSWIFSDGKLNQQRLDELVEVVGKHRLVLDLSCRKGNDRYFVVTDRWQRFTNLEIIPSTFERLGKCCAEFLVHGVDVEGLCQGMDFELIRILNECTALPITYAGGAKSLADLEEVTRLSDGKIDLTIGSALDIFGGTGVRYADAVAFNQRHAQR